MRIFVFGANGMIGRYVHRYIEGSVGVTRKEINAFHIRKDLLYDKLSQIHIKDGDSIINLMGITNKQNKEGWDFLVVNSIFPRLLADYCENRGINMIHISSDCVFSGQRGFYYETEVHDDENIYGLSKSCGEPPNCTVIRTSVIGETPYSNLDLLEWVRKHQREEIRGFTDHYWNGITCLQFAKICKQMIDNKDFWRGVRHIHSPDRVSKFELVGLINEIYELGNKIIPYEAEIWCNRILTSLFSLDKFNIPPIREQIIEQKKWTSDFL